DLVHDVDAFHYLAEAGVVSVQVLGVFPAVADEELGSARISSCMRHGQYASVMVLVVPCSFTIYFITWPPCTVSYRTASLDHKVWDHPMEGKPVIKTFLREFYKIVHRIGSIVLVKLHFHYSFFSMYFCCFHKMFFYKNRKYINDLNFLF